MEPSGYKYIFLTGAVHAQGSGGADEGRKERQYDPTCPLLYSRFTRGRMPPLRQSNLGQLRGEGREAPKDENRAA